MSDSGRHGGDGPEHGGDQGEPLERAEPRADDLLDALHRRLSGLEDSLRPETLREIEQRLAPAWRRVTQGEPRWQVALATLVAICLQFPLPDRLVLLRPVWLLPALQGVLFVVLLAANPRRIDRQSRIVRGVSLVLIALISLANIWSAGRLVNGLIHSTEGGGAGPLLGTGAAIWLTNVIVFALWFWEFDRGGPVARMGATHQFPDFQFVQMTNPDLAPPLWEPMFPDYLYLSFTNAMAFSPTDVMPLSRWAKTLMLVQSLVSLATVVLVIARAVNILR